MYLASFFQSIFIGPNSVASQLKIRPGSIFRDLDLTPMVIKYIPIYL